MGKFKNFDREPATETPEKKLEIGELSPLFREFDPAHEGGLAVNEQGRVVEVFDPEWVHNGKYDIEDRATVLPIRITEEGEFVLEIKYEFDPAKPTLGVEAERDTRHAGKAHRILKDGTQLIYPDGTTEDRKSHPMQFDPEGFKTSIEYSIDMAFGWDELNVNLLRKAVQFELWLEAHDLHSAHVGVLGEAHDDSDITEDSYVLDLNSPDRMRLLAEFAGLSEQLHTLMATYPAMRHALIRYQPKQAVTSLVVAGAPIRDGKFETGLMEHYHDDYLTKNGELVMPPHDYSRYLASKDFTPYDWRELSRVYGSPSSGAYSEVPPPTLEGFLRLADQQLHEGKIISSVRALGWHTDRARIDQGSGEFSNMPASPNLYKSIAIKEIVSKYVIAEQVYYLSGEADLQALEKEYAHAIDIAQPNNFFMSISGKETEYLTVEGLRSASDIMADMIAHANAYCPEPISREAINEVMATLETPPPVSEFGSIYQVFDYFFSPGSRMNGNEALVYAHQIAPEIPEGELLEIFATHRRAHVYKVAQENGIHL